MTQHVTVEQLRAMGDKRGRLERLGYGKPKRTEYCGRMYASKLEAEHAAKLDWMLKARQILAWEPQRRVQLLLGGLLITTWVPDFLVVELDRTLTAHEVKGHLRDRSDWPVKAKLALALKLVDRVRVFRGPLEVEAPRALPPTRLLPAPRSAATAKLDATDSQVPSCSG